MAHTAHTDHFASFAEFYPYYLKSIAISVSRGCISSARSA